MPKRAKKGSGVAARKAWKTRRATEKAQAALVAAAQLKARELQVGKFRPAIAADGALLLLGQAKAGELSGPETRVLAEFLRRVDETGARA